MTGPQQYPDPQGYGQQGGNPGGGFQPAPAAPQYAAYAGGVDPERPASGGTAITAGVLAVLGGLYAIYGVISNFSQSGDIPAGLPDSFGSLLVISGVVAIIEVLTLLPGGIMMFLRKPISKWLVVAGCVVHILAGVISIFIFNSIIGDANIPPESQAALGAVKAAFVIVLLISLLPAIATLVLSLVPLTGRYLAQGGRPPQQQQQYPQQQY